MSQQSDRHKGIREYKSGSTKRKAQLEKKNRVDEVVGKSRRMSEFLIFPNKNPISQNADSLSSKSISGENILEQSSSLNDQNVNSNSTPSSEDNVLKPESSHANQISDEQIYPSLKEEGSVLGGATQRVTSSEIGYAGSPPRALLTRGCSMDSTDRPFHPSEWVDVNLEVPSTPRASSALTNLTVDTNLYPTTTTTTSSCPNLMESETPVPPPRKRKRNRGRPLPPKPDDATENHRQVKLPTSKDEPLYSWVKTPKSESNYFDSEDSETDSKRKSGSFEDSKKSKEVYEHKVNGTGRIIPSDVVSGGRISVDKRNSRSSDLRSQGKVHEEGYERFLSSRPIQVASTPNHLNKDSKDAWKLDHNTEASKKPKNSSTISLPNYHELQIFDERFEDIAWRGDFEGFRGNTLEKDDEKLKDLNEIQSKDSVDFNGIKNQDGEEQSISKTNTFPDSGGLGSSETLIESLITGDVIKTSTPIKTIDEVSRSTGKLEISTSSNYTPAFDLSASGHEEKNRNVGDGSRNCLFSDASNLRSEVFYEAEEIFPVPEDSIEPRSEDRKSDFDSGDPSKILRRSLSNESEPFESYEEKELALDFQHSRIHKTISEESLPLEMLEAIDSDLDRADDDREDDFFEEKIAKDVQNKITKNSVVPNETKEVLKTPPPSPEPKIKAEILGNDHSTLLKVLQEEAAVAAGSNLSSMTPSLTELEVALSDMLEKRDEQEDLDDLFNQKDSFIQEDSFNQEDSLEKKEEDSRTKSTEPRSPEKLIEPCIVPVEKGKKFKENEDNFIASEDVKKLNVSVDFGLNGNDLEGTRISEDKVKIVAVELKDGSVINNSEKNKSPFEVEKEILNNSSKNNVKSYKILSFSFDSKDSKDENSLVDETPEKPSRMHRINLTDSVENDGNAPTPPRRRHRSGSSVLKENVCRTTNNGSRDDKDPYANDRLI